VNDSYHFYEDDLNRDHRNLNNLIAIMSGEPAEVTMRKCLINSGASGISNLRSCNFNIGFDAQGEITVTSCVPA
jgi:hypothetical protein